MNILYFIKKLTIQSLISNKAGANVPICPRKSVSQYLNVCKSTLTKRYYYILQALGFSSTDLKGMSKEKNLTILFINSNFFKLDAQNY